MSENKVKNDLGVFISGEHTEIFDSGHVVDAPNKRILFSEYYLRQGSVFVGIHILEGELAQVFVFLEKSKFDDWYETFKKQQALDIEIEGTETYAAGSTPRQ